MFSLKNLARKGLTCFFPFEMVSTANQVCPIRFVFSFVVVLLSFLISMLLCWQCDSDSEEILNDLGPFHKQFFIVIQIQWIFLV